MTITKDTLIEDLDFTTNTYNCLKSDGVYSVAKLLERPVSRVRDVPGFNQQSFDEVVDKLALSGLKLR